MQACRSLYTVRYQRGISRPPVRNLHARRQGYGRSAAVQVRGGPTDAHPNDINSLKNIVDTKLRESIDIDYVSVDDEVRLRVVSRSFEGMGASLRDFTVKQALGEELGESVKDLPMMYMTPAEAAASLKKWC